ncbi:MAG: hypothetical protein ACMG55_18815 [Microcoleus sp.]
MKLKTELFFLTLIVASCNTMVPFIATDYCIQPSNSIGYNTSIFDDVSDFPPQEIAPPSPWLAVEDISNLTTSPISLNIDLGKEILWLNLGSARINGNFEHKIILYNPENATFTNLTLETPYAISRDFNFTADGSIWVRNIFTPENDKNFPILSKYNYDSNSNTLTLERDVAFYPDTFTSEDLSSQFYDGELINQTRLLIDNDGAIWFFPPSRAIYRYDPSVGKINEVAQLPNLVVSYVAANETKTIFFTGYSPATGPLSERLFSFDTKLYEANEIVYRLEPWPLLGSNLKFDRSGRLWFGGLGWMESDEKWMQLIRQPIFVLYGQSQDPLSPRWRNPFLLLESSDGRLWFTSENGNAWLDLEKEKWCWFTTYQSNIVEDSDHNLWMVADGKLYKNPLGK